jgi:hypothetical protein
VAQPHRHCHAYDSLLYHRGRPSFTSIVTGVVLFVMGRFDYQPSSAYFCRGRLSGTGWLLDGRPGHVRSAAPGGARSLPEVFCAGSRAAFALLLT